MLPSNAIWIEECGCHLPKDDGQVFTHQAGRNVEVYVDDMIVKSEAEDKHQVDLEETFNTIRRYNLKLNPGEMFIWHPGQKISGFHAHTRGIEVNPEKCKAIMGMRSPSNVKEVQQLTGRVASLARFLSKSIDRALPFFQCLKKNDRFEWSTNCE